MSADFPPETEIADLARALSNAGRWGPDDQLGTLNYITPAKRVAAATLVRSGRVVSIGRDLDTNPSPRNPIPVRHVMRFTAHDAPAAADEFTIAPHGFAVTHLDAVSHVHCDGVIYNDRRADDVYVKRGLTFGDIMVQKDGIVTRGVLLDVADARGVPWLSRDDGVTVADLEAAERLAGVTVESGDAIFVRIGLGPREAGTESEDPSWRTGLMPECLRWLHEREVAVYSGDCVERSPTPYEHYPAYLHHVGLAAMGLILLDMPDVEPLAEACADENRHEFLLATAPLRLPGGTGSPVNPLCLF